MRVACFGGAADAGCFQFGGVPSAQAAHAVGDAFPFALGQAVKIGSLDFGGSIALPGKFAPNGEGVQPAPAVFHVCGAAGIEAAGADARQGVNAAAVLFGFGSDVHLSICSSDAAAVWLFGGAGCFIGLPETLFAGCRLLFQAARPLPSNRPFFQHQPQKHQPAGKFHHHAQHGLHAQQVLEHGLPANQHDGGNKEHHRQAHGMVQAA